MKKFVSFCVATAVAVSAVPAMAQCSSCGGAPAFSQPVMSSYAPQATYSAPMMSQPVYSQPVVSAPVMSQPVYSSPVVSAPMMSQPVYSQPVVSAPVMSQPVYSSPVVSAPMMSQPVYNSAPMVSSGCNSCGGAVMGGEIVGSPVMGGQIISGSVMGGEVISGGVSGGQIISWEGGTEIQGTIVSDVLVEGGEAAATEEATDAGNNVDVVEPPAAEAAEESPGPDSDEESTEGDA